MSNIKHHRNLYLRLCYVVKTIVYGLFRFNNNRKQKLSVHYQAFGIRSFSLYPSILKPTVTMTTLDFQREKQPFKIIEIPLNKFLEEVIPHHQEVFERHKTVCQKLLAANQTKELSREVRDKERIVKQVKDLMYELDSLRAHVENEDLDKFDAKTLSLRKIILNLMNGYKSFRDISAEVTAKQEEEENHSSNEEHPFSNVTQLHIDGNIDDIKLSAETDRLEKVEAIEEDVKDLHEIYTHLNEMVGDQQINVEHVHESVESTNTNVQSGLRNIIKAHKLKASAYSVTGAFLGGIIGGPIGLVAGLKVGGLAALGCAVAGYTGGKYLKNINDDKEINTTGSDQPDQPNQEATVEDQHKKGI